MATRDRTIDYYEVLGVSAVASAEAIKDAYRRLARDYHPDQNRGATDAVRRIAEERLKTVNEAYEHLGKPEARARYDAVRRTSTTPSGPAWQEADARAHNTNRRNHQEQAQQERRAAEDEARARRLANLRTEYEGLMRQRAAIADRYSAPLSEARRDDEVAEARWQQAVKAGQGESRLRRRGAGAAWLIGAAGTFAVLVAVAQGLAQLDLTAGNPPPQLTYMLLGCLGFEWAAIALIRASGEARRLPRAALTALLFMPLVFALYVWWCSTRQTCRVRSSCFWRPCMA